MDPTIFELFGALPQQGPGSDAFTAKALELVPGVSEVRQILDVGCGTGRQTLALLAHSRARVTAVDIWTPFLEALGAKARRAGFQSRLAAVACAMDALPFESGSFDLVWSEGSAYVMGFENALRSWRRLLRAEGSVALSELTWFRPDPPGEIREYFRAEYPDMASAEERARLATRSGYRVLGQFPLPAEAWWRDFYHPLEQEIEKRSGARHAGPELVELLAQCRVEIEMFRKHSDCYGYTFFVLGRTGSGG